MTTVLVGIALAWIAVAIVVSVAASRRLHRAETIIVGARDNLALLQASPSRPMLVHPNGKIAVDPQLARSLGVTPTVDNFRALGANSAGLAAADFDSLNAAVEQASASATSLAMRVRVAGTTRVFDVRGGPAPTSEPPGTLLLWFVDTSDDAEERDKLEHRLQQTEAALNSLTHLIEAAPFPMWYRGPDLRLGLVNNAFVQAVEGTNSADVIERGLELFDGSGAASPIAFARTAQTSGQIGSQMQAAIIRGERRMLRVVDVPLSTGAVAGFAIDIQDLQDARGELARHIEAQRELADRMTAGTAQFDPDHCLSFFNRPFAAMTQLDPDWLAERPEFSRVIEQMREQQRVPETRDFPAWREERRAWFTSAEEVVEEEWMLPNGDHIRVVAQPLPDGGLRLFLEDRTEQIRLASARDTLLRVRAATFDNLFEAISVFASDGRLYLWNRRFIEDWELDEPWLAKHPRVDELVPAMARKLVNPTAAATIREIVRKTTNERERANGRLSMTDGRQFEFAAVPLPDGNALLTMVDVTDSSRIEAALRERATALEEADRVKTDFVANMSYELRTPLTSIGGFAEMLGAGYAGKLSDKGAEYTTAILESVDRLSKLINDVLDLTTSDVGRQVLEHERVDIAGLCRAAADGVQPRAAEKAQKLDIRIESSAGHVFGDSRRLRESVEHVLGNAISYTDRRGKIVLKAAGDDKKAVITVTDNGAGIASEDLPRVFNRFDRVAEASIGGEAALGLGLPLTRQFVEAHGGTVELESEEGKGTVVTLTIPRGSR